MSRLSAINKNKTRKKLIDQYAAKRKALKDIIYDKDTSDEERFKTIIKLSQLPRNSSKIRHRNRCELTGRPRGYYRKFKMSRVELRRCSSFGLIPGITKSSW
jgi:small subunit ribosomal protein S14